MIVLSSVMRNRFTLWTISRHFRSYCIVFENIGRPNTIINDDRGWLFLERITIAIKRAGAHRFDEIDRKRERERERDDCHALVGF